MKTRDRRGFALLAALALLVTISVVALEIDLHTRPRRLAVAAAAEHTAALGAAMAGVEHARAMLVRYDPEPVTRLMREPSRIPDPWGPLDGKSIGPRAVGAASYRVELHDAYAKLPLNAASEDELRNLLLALRVDARRAERVAQAIADWRDRDDFRRANGAERAEYLRAGAPLLPENGPFGSVEDLRFVLGVTDSLLERVQPDLTVIGDGGINLNAAPRPVLLALPGMTDEAVNAILRIRAAGGRVSDLGRFAQSLSSGARQRLMVAMPMLRSRVTLETREMHVVSVGELPGSPVRVRVDAVVSRDAQDRVTWWRESP